MSPTLVPNRTLASEPITEDSFQLLVSEWDDATAFKSNPMEIIGHPAFRRIVALGKDAVPFVLRELKKKPSFLVFALDEITDENPFPPTAKRNVTEMTKVWLAWAKKRVCCGTRPTSLHVPKMTRNERISQPCARPGIAQSGFPKASARFVRVPGWQ